MTLANILVVFNKLIEKLKGIMLYSLSFSSSFQINSLINSMASGNHDNRSASLSSSTGILLYIIAPSFMKKLGTQRDTFSTAVIECASRRSLLDAWKAFPRKRWGRICTGSPSWWSGMVRAGTDEGSFAEVGTIGTVAHLVRRWRRNEVPAAGGSSGADSAGGLGWTEDAVHMDEYSLLNFWKPPEILEKINTMLFDCW